MKSRCSFQPTFLSLFDLKTLLLTTYNLAHLSPLVETKTVTDATFQTEKSFGRRMRPRHGNVRSGYGSTLTQLPVGEHSALAEFASEFI